MDFVSASRLSEHNEIKRKCALITQNLLFVQDFCQDIIQSGGAEILQYYKSQVVLGLLRGVAASLLLTANLIAGTTCSFVFIVLAKVLPSPLSEGCMWVVRVLVWVHAYGIRLGLRYVSGVRWTIDCPDDYSSSSRYVMMVNHRSQMDILCLMAACVDRLPPMKFFLKRSLMYGNQ